jgi:hypothetical protein
MTDTRERFLREITTHVSADRIAELHLFRPLRRGATETGIAVIAAERTGAHPVFDAAAALPVADETIHAAVADPVADEAIDAGASDPVADEAIDADAIDAEAADAIADSPYADAPAEEIAHPERLTVFTARYRLTVKGAERGKWEFDVVADADAPLTTVDTVVRGVQRRAGDEEEPERLTADGVRAALDGQSWRATT